MTQFKLNRTAPAESPKFRQLRRSFEELAELIGLNLLVYDKDSYLVDNPIDRIILASETDGTFTTKATPIPSEPPVP